MSTSVTINGSTYSIPSQGQNPPWGKDLSDVLVAITSVLSSLSGPSDINLTTFNIANNQSAAANVTGASFDTSQVRSFIMQYSVSRTTSTQETTEVGSLYGAYNSTAGTWELMQYYAGLSGVVFSITSSGQLQYTSSNMSGSTPAGKIKFKATSFLQA